MSGKTKCLEKKQGYEDLVSWGDKMRDWGQTMVPETTALPSPDRQAILDDRKDKSRPRIEMVPSPLTDEELEQLYPDLTPQERRCKVEDHPPIPCKEVFQWSSNVQKFAETRKNSEICPAWYTWYEELENSTSGIKDWLKDQDIKSGIVRLE